MSACVYIRLLCLLLVITHYKRKHCSDCPPTQLKSALEAVEGNTAVVIANGLKQGDTVLDIVRGKPVGTFITRNGHDELVIPTERMAEEGVCMFTDTT